MSCPPHIVRQILLRSRRFVLWDILTFELEGIPAFVVFADISIKFWNGSDPLKESLFESCREDSVYILTIVLLHHIQYLLTHPA